MSRIKISTSCCHIDSASHHTLKTQRSQGALQTEIWTSSNLCPYLLRRQSSVFCWKSKIQACVWASCTIPNLRNTIKKTKLHVNLYFWSSTPTIDLDNRYLIQNDNLHSLEAIIASTAYTSIIKTWFEWPKCKRVYASPKACEKDPQILNGKMDTLHETGIIFPLHQFKATLMIPWAETITLADVSIHLNVRERRQLDHYYKVSLVSEPGSHSEASKIQGRVSCSSTLSLTCWP